LTDSSAGGRVPAKRNTGARGEREVSMRRLIMALILGALVAIVPMTSATARGPKWQFSEAPPFTLPAEVCGFPVLVEAVQNREYSKTTPNADGSVTIQITGFFSSRYTNLDTDSSLTAKISGPITIRVAPDGSFDVAARGRNGIIFFPADAARFGFPGISIMAGRFTEHVAADGTFTSAHLDGTIQLDVCAALS
jgi:hypothetical protein